jgi:hypothetical protein
MRYLSESEAMQMSGIGEVGDIVQGSDGHLYEWVEGIDGLGNPVGLWKRLRRLARAAQPLLQRALPIARKIAPFVPGGAAVLTAAAPILKQAGIEGYGGIGALYEASDGTVYQMQGLSERDELQGFLADEELSGLEQDDELRGLEEDEELRGLSQEEELRGLEADEELQGLEAEEELSGVDADEELNGVGDEEPQGIAADDDLQGMDDDDPLSGLEQGYVRQDGVNGIEAYVPQQAPATRWFKAPGEAPDMWKPLW